MILNQVHQLPNLTSLLTKVEVRVMLEILYLSVILSVLTYRYVEPPQ
jgi:hypothetical protein